MASDADIIILLVTGILLLGSAVRRIGKNERAAVIRLGRFHRVDGPGTILIIPFVDKVRKIDLDAALPHWRGISPAEIAEHIRREVLKA